MGKDGAIMTARRALSEGLQVTWLGHSTFKLRSPGGKILLIDPWVAGNPACPDDQKTIDQLDLMLITHGHFDHIPDAVDIAPHTRPQIVAIYEISQWMGSKGIDKASMHDLGNMRYAICIIPRFYPRRYPYCSC